MLSGARKRRGESSVYATLMPSTDCRPQIWSTNSRIRAEISLSFSICSQEWGECASSSRRSLSSRRISLMNSFFSMATLRAS